MLNDLDWRRLVWSLCSTHAEDTLHRIIQTTGWPAAEVLVPLLQDTSFAYDHQRLPSTYTLNKANPKRDEFWKELIAHYKLTLGQSFPSQFPMWLVSYGVAEGFAQLLRQSDPKQVEYWLQQKSEFRILGSGYDKGTNLMMLVDAGQTQVLEALNDVCPHWSTLADKKGRTPLFMANSVSMVEFLLTQGVDPTVKNQDGQTAVDFWVENKLRHATECAEKVNAAQSDPTSSMVVKFFQFRKDFNQEEQKEFDAMVQDPHWSWRGRLGGFERTWSKEEIWRYAELSMVFHLQPSPDFYPKSHYYYAYTDFQSAGGALVGAREAFPDLAQQIDNPARGRSMFEQALWYWMVMQDKPSVCPITFSHAKGSYSSHISMQVAQLMGKQGEEFLARLPLQDKEEFNKAMVEIVRQPWVEEKCGYKLQVYMKALTKPAELGGMMTESVAKAVVEDRQHEGWRGRQVVALFAKEFQQVCRTSLPEMESNPNAWRHVGRVALCYAGTAESLLTKDETTGEKVQHVLVQLIKQGMEMDKVPVRWTKYYTSELQSSVTRWVIETTLEKRQKKKAEPAPVAPKRKM